MVILSRFEVTQERMNIVHAGKLKQHILDGNARKPSCPFNEVDQAIKFFCDHDDVPP
jgi:hypothetical protein